mgnify:FL=1
MKSQLLKYAGNILGVLVVMVVSPVIYGQVSINDTGEPPHEKAMLDVASSSPKGILLIRMNENNRESITGAPEGLLVYDSTNHAFFFWNNERWVQFEDDGVWELDTINGSGRVFLVESSDSVGIGTDQPSEKFQVIGNISASSDIHSGGDSAVNFKKTAAGDSIAGVDGYGWSTGPLSGWTGFPGLEPQSAQIIDEMDGHKHVAELTVQEGSSGGPSGTDFFVVYQPFFGTNISFETWIRLTSPGLLLGLIKPPPGDQEPLYVAAFRPDFQNESYSSMYVASQNDSAHQNFEPVGSLALDSWIHFRIDWVQGEYCKAWINGTKIADLDGSTATPDAFIIGGFDTTYFDGLGMSSAGYEPYTNLGPQKVSGKVGVFDAVIAKDWANYSNFLPTTGGTITGNLQMIKSFNQADTNSSGSGILLSLSAQDSIGERNGLEIRCSSYAWESESNSDQQILADGYLNIGTADPEMNLGVNRSSDFWNSPHNINIWGDTVSSGRSTWMQVSTGLDETLTNNDHDVKQVNDSDNSNADTIVAHFQSGEDYSSWANQRMKMTSGEAENREFWIDTAIVSGDVFVILEEWYSSWDLAGIAPGDEFSVLGNELFSSINIESGYQINTDTSFAQTIFATHDLQFSAREFRFSSGPTDDLKIKQNGDIYIPDGMLGVGTEFPGSDIHIESNSLNRVGMLMTHSNTGSGITDGLYLEQWEDTVQISNNQTGPMYFNTAGYKRLLSLQDDGNVGINTDSSEYAFQVVINSSNQGHVTTTGAWSNTSDLRFKKNLQPLEPVLEKMEKANPVRFTWKYNNMNDIGLIAQDVEKIFPEFVDSDSYGNKSLAYSQITTVLWQAILELKQEVETLKIENQELKDQIDRIK